MSSPEQILAFWFGDPTAPTYGKPRKIWFRKDPRFDAEIRRRFESDYQQAAAGRLQAWRHTAYSCLALLLLLDQMPRNMYRQTPQAYATDPLALEVAQYAVAQGFDQIILPVQRWFVYLPFEHSEDLEQQGRAVDLFNQLQDQPDCHEAIDSAHKHLQVIQRFGRFPHRNAILGRPSTPEEESYLRQAGSRF
ncbi:MAG: DUF924 domain-containing protein [Synechococcaceae cyanobacterium SM2_3_1]|nr:DUF924 domain-containing protein [Synechococcaceae cyanobacterium SM2_3_1]